MLAKFKIILKLEKICYNEHIYYVCFVKGETENGCQL